MPTTDSALDGLRVIDLAHPYGQYAGKLLADMGADVIKIEPPEGDLGRRIRPFKDGASLFWVYYNSGKRVVALDLAKPEGQDELRRLIAGANAVISFDPAAANSTLGISPFPSFINSVAVTSSSTLNVTLSLRSVILCPGSKLAPLTSHLSKLCHSAE